MENLIGENLTGFAFAAFALLASPGPATLSLAATGAVFGTKRGLGYLIGIELGMVLIMVFTATGVMGVVLAIPRAAQVVTGVGAAYILYMAYRIATASPFAKDEQDQRHPTILGGLLLSLVNPKAYASLAALFSGFILVKDNFIEDVASKAVVLLIILTVVDVVWLVLGGHLSKSVQNPKTARIVNVIFAVSLVLSVGFAVL